MEKKFRWQDATTYSRGDKERKPTAWAINGVRLRIYITCDHRFAPGGWVMHCYPWLDTIKLEAKTLEEAKSEAIQRVAGVVANCVNDIEKFRDRRRMYMHRDQKQIPHACKMRFADVDAINLLMCNGVRFGFIARRQCDVEGPNYCHKCELSVKAKRLMEKS